MADRYWVSAIPGLFSDPLSINWSTTSGGAPGASVPGATDRARYNGNGLGDCQFDLALTGQDLRVDAGYSGTLDAATDNLNHTVGNGSEAIFFIDNGAGSNPTFTPGTGLWTISNANVVLSSTETFILSGDWRVSIATSLNWDVQTNDLIRPYELTIQAGVTMTSTIAGLIMATGSGSPTVLVQGTLHLNVTGQGLQIPDGGTLTVDSGGLISGAVGSYINTSTSSTTTFISNGTISTEVRPTLSNGETVTIDGTGTYDAFTIVKLAGSSATNLILKGSPSFTGKVSISGAGSGTFTINNSTNNPSLQFDGDVEITNNTGGITYTKGTGTITFGGSADQRLDFDGEAIEDVEIDKSAGVALFNEAVTMDSLHGISGTLDIADVTVTVVGNATFDDGFNVQNSSLVTQTRLPTGNSATGDRDTWTASAGNKWDCVDDPIGTPDDDATYTEILDASGVQHHTFTAFSIPTGAVILRVSVYGRARRTTTAINFFLDFFDTVTRPSANISSVGTSYISVVADWFTDPATLLAWTEAAVEAIIECGYQNGATVAGEGARVTQNYIECAYYIPGGSAGLLIVGGNLDINGLTGSHVTWEGVDLDVTGTATADYTDVSDSDASAGTEVTASNSSNDGGNTNWNFGSAEYTLDATTGEYVLTGQGAGLLASRLLPSAHGSYALSGQAVGLLSSRILAAQHSTYATSGQDASLLAGRRLALDNGAYALSGQVASLLASRYLSITHGAYSYVGQDAALLRGYVPLVADHGAFALSGQAASLLAARRFALNHGVYILTGQSADLVNPADRGWLQVAGIRVGRQLDGSVRVKTMLASGVHTSVDDMTHSGVRTN